MENRKEAWAGYAGGLILIIIFGTLALVAAGGWNWFAKFLENSAPAWVQAIGSVIAIFVSVHLVNAQHERVIKLDRSTLRIALLAELTAIKAIFDLRINSKQDATNPCSIFIPEIISTKAYSLLLAKIGLLSSNEIKSIIDAYLLLDDLPNRLGLLSVVPNESYNRKGFIYIAAEHTITASDLHKSFLPKIILAINTLQQNIDNK